MSQDEKIAAFESLHRFGFRFVLCAKNKQPIQSGWQDIPYPKAHTCIEHFKSGGLLGVVPGSMFWVVIDQDHGKKEELLESVPRVAFTVNSSTDTRYHHWLKFAKRGGEVGNAKWSRGESSGEIRGHKGFVILWDPVGVDKGTTKHHTAKPATSGDLRAIMPKKRATPTRTGAPHMTVSKNAPKPDRPSGKDDRKTTAPPSNIKEEYIDGEIARMREAKEGERNDLLNIIVGDAYRKGLADDDFEDRILDAATDAGLDEAEAVSTINSARRYGISECKTPEIYGERASPMAGSALNAALSQADNEGFVYEDATISTIEQAMKDIGWQIRYNVLSARQEAKKTSDTQWQDITSSNGAMIRRELEDRCFLKRGRATAPFTVRRERFRELMEVLEEDPEYHINPVSNWQKSLPAWDKKQRLSTIFSEALGCRQDKLSAWAGYYMFCSPLIRAATKGGEGQSLDQMIFLVGPQGCGKSKFIRESLPENLRPGLINQDYDPSWDEKRQIEAIIGKFFVEAGELQITRHFSVNRLKAFLSTTMDEARLAYRTRTKMYPRSATMIATINENDGVPDDYTGNRRFIPLFCPGVNHTALEPNGGYHVHDYWNHNRDQVWAEAFLAKDNILSGAMTLRMDEDTIKIRDYSYQGARQRDEHLEDVMPDVLDWLSSEAHKRSEFPDVADEMEGLRLPHVMDALANRGVNPFNLERRAARLLHRLGYAPKRVYVPGGNGQQRRWCRKNG